MCQHHDSITGTAKQHVANDYNKRIHKGMAEAQAVVANALTHLIYGGRPAAETKQAGEEGSGGARQLHAKPQEQLALAAAALTSEGAPLLGAHKLHACNWLNVSSCEPTVELSQTGRGMFAVAYNPLAWSREAPVRVPVSTKTTCTWEVTGKSFRSDCIFCTENYRLYLAGDGKGFPSHTVFPFSTYLKDLRARGSVQRWCPSQRAPPASKTFWPR